MPMHWPEDLTSTALSGRMPPGPWPDERWSTLFRQARVAGLLGRVAAQLDESGRAGPAAAARHAEAALRVCRAQQDEICREIRFIQHALAGLGAPVVLLKGAAYVMAGLPAAQGRVFSDIDIMVPKAVLAQAESMLMLGGWMTTHHTAYDQRYYRQWMHELPPMEHVQRSTVLDVHHTILPETARLRPDPHKLFEASEAVPGQTGLRMLCAPDMVLHSMTHLFMNDDMNHALRDLSDLDLLLRHFARDAQFWTQLVERAALLDLRRPLFYGLRYTARLLGTPVAPQASAALRSAAPGAALLKLMDAIWLRALRSPHPATAPAGRAAALGALYVRGHWLRMPPLLLARHLTIKALRRHEGETPPEPETPH